MHVLTRQRGRNRGGKRCGRCPTAPPSPNSPTAMYTRCCSLSYSRPRAMRVRSHTPLHAHHAVARQAAGGTCCRQRRASLTATAWYARRCVLSSLSARRKHSHWRAAKACGCCTPAACRWGHARAAQDSVLSLMPCVQPGIQWGGRRRHMSRSPCARPRLAWCGVTSPPPGVPSARATAGPRLLRRMDARAMTPVAPSCLGCGLMVNALCVSRSRCYAAWRCMRSFGTAMLSGCQHRGMVPT